MERCFEVGIYGRSLFLAGIESSLKKQEGIRVRWLGDSLDEALWEIRMLSPQVILYEVSDASQLAAAAIMRQYPELWLLGLDPERDTVTIFSSSKQTVSSGEELVRIVLQAAGRAGDNASDI